MIGISHNGELPQNLWITEGFSSAIFEFNEKGIEIVSSFLSRVKKIFHHFFVSFSASFLEISVIVFFIPVVVIAIAVILLLLPVTILVSYRALKKLKELKQTLISKIEKQEFTKKELIKQHTNTRELIDKILIKFGDSPANSYMSKWALSLLNELKEIEMIERIAAYPERNEIVLTYDEMRELLSLTKEFECASEQSDIYTSSSI